VYRFAFSGHAPLVTALESLALSPDAAGRFAGLPAGLRPLSFSIETDLVEQLRRESDEVRDMLTTRGPRENGADRDDSRGKQRFLPEAAGGEIGAKGGAAFPYRAPGKTAMAEFTASLDGTDRAALEALAEGAGIDETEAERINAAFNGRFGDLLVVYEAGKPSISGEYLSILKASWKSQSG
jgi:hypothetical protein